MSVALNQLKPNATNVTSAPNYTWIPGPFISNGSCVEEIVSCGPCSIHIILSAIDGTPVENIYTSPNISKSEELKMYFDTYSTDMTKYFNSNTDLVAENLEKYAENDIDTTTMSAAFKELQRIKNLLFKFNANSKENDTISKLNDDELFDIFTSDENDTVIINSTDETLITDMPLSNIYTELSSTATNDQNIFTDIGMTDATTEAGDVTETSINDEFLAINTTTTDIFTNETYSTEITRSTDDSENTSIDSLGIDSNDLTTYRVTKETAYPYINNSYKTYNVYDTTTAVTDSISTYSESSTDGSMTSIYNRKLCPELSFNCTTVCGGKNITQVFSLTNCSVINRVCYEKKCATHNLTVKISTPNTTVADIVYEDEKRIKQYNLTVPTRKKLLKLCWETMFGQELIKLTMMDLVSDNIFLYNFCSSCQLLLYPTAIYHYYNITLVYSNGYV